MGQAADPPTGALANDPGAAAYQAKLAAYEQAHGAYEAEAGAYWHAVSEKRKVRNAKRRQHARIAASDYVLSQPPVYSGPPKPKNPFAPPTPPGEERQIPVVADFVEAAREQYAFVPDRPQNELEFKRAYAAAALAAGLDKDQVVGIYAFETGGHGAYDTQAGLLFDRPGAHAISPALGYNQLLSTLTISLLAEHGNHVVALLREKERQLSGEPRQRMARKITALRRMIAVARSVPHRWSAYERLAKHTAKGLGMHAVLLDVDIGPLLQVQNLTNSLRFARIKGYEGRMSAAELELMKSCRRRQWRRHGDDAAGLAREGADRELLRARRLLAQPDRAPQQSGGRAPRRDPEPHRPRREEPRRAGAGAGVLKNSRLP